MIGIIILIDQVVWRPAIAWAEKFKFEQVEPRERRIRPYLDLIRHSRILPLIAQRTIRPARRVGAAVLCAQTRMRPGKEAGEQISQCGFQNGEYSRCSWWRNGLRGRQNGPYWLTGLTAHDMR